MRVHIDFRLLTTGSHIPFTTFGKSFRRQFFTHGLGKRPSVTVVDSAGTAVIGEIEYLDDNTVRLTFCAAFSGTAYCN